VASSVVNPDRRWLAWVGGVLLAAATWVRLWDAGVTTPEAYTMPSALALLAVGLVRLRRDQEADTWTTISAGLLLATVPSLATVLTEEPASPRALLLGLGCLVLVLAGAALRWSAPLLVGAGVGLVLVLRESGPYAADLPPWVVIGVAGSLLLVVGVTWEARLLELRRGAAYLGRLR
jgi:cell division protein FtsW (lipid II flippase)